jgi:hypothetical protein
MDLQMQRLPDWRSRLTDYLARAAHQPFKWGEHDCALFAADCIREMTGIDVAEAVRGQYSSAESATEMLQAAGLRDLKALAAGHLERAVPALAQVGDIAVVGTRRRQALGVVVGEMVAVLRADGLGHVPRDGMLAAFRVP